MILLGKTPVAKKSNKERVLKLLSIVNFTFITALLLPALLFLFFNYFYPLKGVSDNDIKSAIVKVEAPDGECGTGFLISPTKVLTARHLLGLAQKGNEVKLLFEGAKNRTDKAAKEVMGRVLFFIETGDTIGTRYFATDFAVIEIPPVFDINPLKLGSSDQVAEGEGVIAAGYPFCQDYFRADNIINSLEYNGETSLFKYNADVSPGSSGSPLVQKSNNAAIAMVVARAGDPGSNVALKVNGIINACRLGGIDLTK